MILIGEVIKNNNGRSRMFLLSLSRIFFLFKSFREMLWTQEAFLKLVSYKAFFRAKWRLGFVGTMHHQSTVYNLKLCSQTVASLTGKPLLQTICHLADTFEYMFAIMNTVKRDFPPIKSLILLMHGNFTIATIKTILTLFQYLKLFYDIRFFCSESRSVKIQQNSPPRIAIVIY